MKKYITVLCVFSLILFIGCKNQTKKDKDTHQQINETSTIIQEFPYPQIPIMVTKEDDRGKYLTDHYWDNINFNDTLQKYDTDLIEQCWVNYIDLVNTFGKDKYKESFKNLFVRLDSGTTTYFKQFTDLADKYLYFANSPLRNDLFYIPICEAIIEGNQLSKIEKERYKFIYNVIQKNNIGDFSEDFYFRSSTGDKLNMHSIKSDIALLFFTNPGCNICTQTIELIRENNLIKSLEKSGKLKVIAIYPDEDIQLWKEHLKDYPSTWIKGYDESQKITDDHLYDLRAIPSLYLLDKNKKVILKDKPIDIILQTLEQM